MGKIIGLSGSQGTGKSTILHGVTALGFKIHNESLPRTAQKMLGWDNLYIAQNSMTHMFDLQDLVLKLLIARDEAILKSDDVVLVERTPADLHAYTLMWLQDYNSYYYQAWYDEYKQKLIEQSAKYDCLNLVPINDKIPFVYDPHRAKEDSRQFIQDNIFEFSRLHFNNTWIVQETDAQKRAIEVAISLGYKCDDSLAHYGITVD